MNSASNNEWQKRNWAAVEEFYLAPWAAHSSQSRGRVLAEDDEDIRTPWQRDRDRILHSKAFRRLKHKTQVFINPRGDHFRTRLTHTLEVCQISRVVSRALHLNEDLTEAIAMGHDLGHTPFGHAGERALCTIFPDFSHAQQGLRLVEKLERDGRGLNLTFETRDGILGHSGKHLPQTLEGAVVRLCDRVGYLNHDVDDAMRSGYLAEDALPSSLSSYLGHTQGQRIGVMVEDIINASKGRSEVKMSGRCLAAIEELREFMFENVYYHPSKLAEEQRLQAMVISIFNHFCAHPEQLPAENKEQDVAVAVRDYIAGMTDNFALELAEQLKL